MSTMSCKRGHRQLCGKLLTDVEPWVNFAVMKTPAIEDAITAAGSISALAAQLGISHQAVAKWLRRGRPPAERCLEIERVTGVSRYDLRPDVYGEKPDAAVA